MMTKLIGAILFVGMAINVVAFAAVSVQQASSEKKDQYLDEGVFVGGFDQGTLALLNIRHSFQQNVERIVFDVQRLDSKSVERPGFFHIAIKKNPSRVVVQLENVTDSKVTATQATKILHNARFFSKANFFPDKRTRDLTIELPLKRPVKIEAFELVAAGKPGRIVLDAKAQ